MKLRRREFVRGGVAVFSLGFMGSDLMMRMAEAQGTANPARDRDILVLIELSGGNDGLNTVIPYQESAYYTNRPTLGISKAQVLDVGGVGLHPKMKELKALYDGGEVAIIQGAGYPNANQSHFRSMDIWQTAALEPEASLGWIGRYLDQISEDDQNALYGIGFDTDLPRLFRGESAQVPAIPDFASYQYATDPNFPEDRAQQIGAFTQISSHVPVDLPYVGLVQRNIMDAYTTAERIQKAGVYKGTVTYPPNSGLAAALKLVAEVIVRQFGTHLFHVSIGGFDTHANQAGQHATILEALSKALGAFFQDLKNQGLADNVLALTFSEFGRRVQENGSAGTDHGAASPMIAVGGKVKGGLYGTYPSLTALDNGNLKYTVDFRRVYTTVLQSWLGADPSTVLAGTFDPVPFL